jgi:hypothetical protein
MEFTVKITNDNLGEHVEFISSDEDTNVKACYWYQQKLDKERQIGREEVIKNISKNIEKLSN